MLLLEPLLPLTRILLLSAKAAAEKGMCRSRFFFWSSEKRIFVFFYLLVIDFSSQNVCAHANQKIRREKKPKVRTLFSEKAKKEFRRLDARSSAKTLSFSSLLRLSVSCSSSCMLLLLLLPSARLEEYKTFFATWHQKKIKRFQKK